MAIFADNFTDTDGTTLQSHTPDTGTGWSVLWQSSAGVDAEINTNRCRSDGTLNAGVMYTADATYPGADYDVTCTLVSLVAQDDRPIYLLVRVQDQENMYAVRLETTTNESSLYKKVSGTWTQIGSFFTKPANGSVIKLEIIGTSLKFYDDGAELASATVSDLSAAGKAGIAFGGGAELKNGGATDDGSTSNVIDSLTVNDLSAVATLEQEGFRFRDDDDSESAATWLASQDTNASVAANANFRLRMLVNASGDPASSAFRLDYRTANILLADDFDDNTWDTDKWDKSSYKAADTDASVTVVETGGQLEITPLVSTSGTHFNGYLSKNSYDITGGEYTEMVINVLQVADGSNSTVNDFLVVVDENNLFGFDIEGGPTIFFTMVEDNVHDNTSMTWNSTTMKWLRLRYLPGTNTVKWDTSPDGSSWTERRSLANPLGTLSAVKFNIVSGTYDSFATPGEMIVDDFHARTIGSWTAVT